MRRRLIAAYMFAAWLVLRRPAGYARVFPREEPRENYEHCTQPMYTAQVAEFLGAIEEGRQPRPSGEAGRVVMQVVEAAYASTR